MVATVRNRRGVISSVRPWGQDEQLHFVDVEYNDGESPLSESLLWEREPFRRLLEPTALPDPHSGPPMAPIDYAAMARSCRWTARTPYVDPDGSGPLDRLPISSPFHGAVQVEDYQMVPLLKALEMPRVSLLLADDVGLGKTIEAGLILTELILRRRLRRVLILTPASLQIQWKDELWTKFSLPFETVNRKATDQLKRELGVDANPWRSHSRVITSYHYLKQADVLEQFRAASSTDENAGQLPWDLLIVDEAHNVSPAPYGKESDLCAMLRQLAPMFEHRIFLTATPHNGHTRSFTGLLELLDPVRFSQNDQMSAAEKERVSDVLVRRLKREINERTNPKKFCDRLPPEALMVNLTDEEARLTSAFSELKEKIREVTKAEGKKRRLAGNFAIEIFGKRLLSSPYTFAESWRRCMEGLEQIDRASDAEILQAKKNLEDEAEDDAEAQSVAEVTSKVIGGWMRPFRDHMTSEIAAVDQALRSLDLHESDPTPQKDARWEAFIHLIETRLRSNGEWRDDERLVVFTEYKTTLDYLTRRLREIFEDDRILIIYGGMDLDEREFVKGSFNDPESKTRILLGTDAASEGLNLQDTARYVLHYDVPWNPSRLEQRNGRLDRHGQARDVTVWHFATDQDQDLAFLSFVVNKVDAIREDLGSTGEIFDEFTHRRLVEGMSFDEIKAEMERRIEAARSQADVPRDSRITSEEGNPDEIPPEANLNAIAEELDFDSATLKETLDSAMALMASRPRITDPDEDGCSKIIQPHPNAWSPVIDETVRIQSGKASLGALPKLTFDPNNFVVSMNGRPVFRARPNTLLVHLGHPLIQQGLSLLSRQRFPGSGTADVSRWTLSKGSLDAGLDAVVQLTFEELAVNELRETFHHWVRTVRLPIRHSRLEAALPHLSAKKLRGSYDRLSEEERNRALELWDEVARDVRKFVADETDKLTEQLHQQLELDRAQATQTESERYQSRQGEVSSLIESSTMQRIEREIEELKDKRKQGLLFDQERTLDEIDRDVERKQEELRRRTQHYEEIRARLAEERTRIIDVVIPKRHAMVGSAQVMPIGIEIVLPQS